MKLLKTTTFCAAMAASFITGAVRAADAPAGLREEEPRTYLGLQAGMNGLKSWPAEISFGGPVTLPGELKLKSGAQGGISLGRQRGRMRYELELRAGRFDIAGLTIGTVAKPADRSASYSAFLFNAQHSLPLGERSGLLLGLGIGYGKVSLPALTVEAGCNCMQGASKGGLAYQFGLGLEHRLGENDLLFAQAGRLGLPGGASSPGAGVHYPRQGASQFMLGWRHLM